jgi:CBS domain containing-hemolysin-like protein
MLTVILEIGLIVLLTLPNGLLAMSEIAVVSARRARLRRRASEGNRGAQAALELMLTQTRRVPLRVETIQRSLHLESGNILLAHAVRLATWPTFGRLRLMSSRGIMHYKIHS